MYLEANTCSGAVVGGGGDLAISCPDSITLVAGQQMTPVTVSASGGVPPYNYSLAPAGVGLFIGITTGTITGTLPSPAPWTFTITATDAMGESVGCNISVTAT